MKDSSGNAKRTPPAPSFGERLKFVVWLSAKTLGVESAAELARIVGKSQAQLSNWVNENPKPSYENIRLLAETVGVSAPWLDDPTSKDASEPEDFGAWFGARVRAAQNSSRKRGGS